MSKLTPSKAESALLPPFKALLPEQIYVPKTRQEFADATAEIVAAGVAGFDTEAKPLFNKGDVSDGPHVVQFAIGHKAFIFQLNQAECQPFLVELLQSAAVLKVGFGLKSDHGQINNKLGVKLAAVLDMNHVFRRDGYGSSTGVRAAVALVLKQKFHKSKSVTTSNWALPQLNSRQLIYAANDAYAALQVLNALGRSRADLPISGLASEFEHDGLDSCD